MTTAEAIMINRRPSPAYLLAQKYCIRRTFCQHTDRYIFKDGSALEFYFPISHYGDAAVNVIQ